ncbi:MAG: outer membrane lipoprotein-sorting protein [Desulfobulbus propionicus]|nr:MAG: outer membrane lipoprotein-sorting protein [Desulfobulbus propionicus]
MNKTLLTTLLFFMLPGFSLAEMSGREIMLKADAVDTSHDTTLKLTMIIERGSQKLVRAMEHFTKQYGDDLKDERSLIRFLKPADVYKTAYLTWSYDAIDREDDMWVYLPSEKLVRRISGGGKKGSFMRSDLANEDIEDRSVDDDTHKLLESREIDGAACWVVASTPREELKKETNYSKRISFIRKDIYLPVRTEYYDKRGKLLKTAIHGGFKKIDGIWTITKSVFATPSRKTRTLFQRTDIVYNSGIDDSLFLQSNLKR